MFFSFSNIVMAYILLTLARFYFLLPTSPCVLPHRRFFKHRPDALWFRSHRIMQCTGLLCAIVGWSIALSQFEGNIWSHRILTSCGKCIWLDSDSTCVCVCVCVCVTPSALEVGSGTGYLHGVCGMCVMSLGIIQASGTIPYVYPILP
jgi:hypothetical protein